MKPPMQQTTELGFPVGRVTPCEWGRGVQTLDDLLPCLAHAERRVTITRPEDGKHRDFELCAHHLRMLLVEADKNGTDVR